MAHNVETMAYANAVPWHGLGVNVEDTVTTEEMLVKAGIDWTVSKRPMYAVRATGDGEMTEAPVIRTKGFNALVRDKDERVLDIVGDNYIPIQNYQAMEFFKEFCETGEMKLETAGSLDGGKHIWVLASINESFNVNGNALDPVGGYVLLSQPHIYGKALNIMFTPIRVVCNNTLTLALNSHNKLTKVRMPHVRVFDKDAQVAAKIAMGLAKENLARFREQADLLASKKANIDQIVRYLAKLFQPQLLEGTDPITGSNVIDWSKYSRNLQEVKAAIGYQPGAKLDTSDGTWWGVLNGVTYTADHVFGHNRDSALAAAWFGHRATLKREALKLATEFANAA